MTTDEFLALLPHVQYWEAAGDSGIKCVTAQPYTYHYGSQWSRTGARRHTTWVPLDILHAVHPDLPQALCIIIAAVNQKDRTAPGDYLRAQCAYLRAPFFLPATDGTVVGVTHLNNMVLSANPGVVVLTGFFYQVSELTYTPREYVMPAPGSYVTAHSGEPCLVLRSYLDERWPGWENRFAVAHSLATRPEDLTSYVFPAETPISAMSLPDIEIK